MSNPFPIASAVNVVSTIFLAVLSIHLWTRRKRIVALSVRSFIWVFTLLFLLMLIFSLPGLVVKDLAGIQLLFNIGDLIMCTIFVSFALFLCAIVFPNNRSLQILIPAFLGIYGIGLFLWEMTILAPVNTLILELIKNKPFIIYKNSVPEAVLVITGVFGLIILISGSLICLTRAKDTKNPILHRRSIFFGLGCMMGAIAVLLNFIFAIFSNIVIHILSSVAVFMCTFFIYKGALTQIEESETRIGNLEDS